MSISTEHSFAVVQTVLQPIRKLDCGHRAFAGRLVHCGKFSAATGCVLFLLLSFVLLVSRADAAARPAPPPQQTAPTTAVAAAPTIDCDHPIPGEKAMLIGEDEIAIVYHTDKHKALSDVYWDASGSNLVYKDGSYRSTITSLQDIAWPAIAWGDLNGDGQYEYISVFRDKNKRVGAVTDKTSATWYWYNNNAVWEGDDVAYLDVATGDLDRADNDDEIVIASGTFIKPGSTSPEFPNVLAAINKQLDDLNADLSRIAECRCSEQPHAGARFVADYGEAVLTAAVKCLNEKKAELVRQARVEAAE